MMSVLFFIDEKEELNKLSSYVATSPDCMPSIRLAEGATTMQRTNFNSKPGSKSLNEQINSGSFLSMTLTHSAVIAIDIGSAFCGYAFCSKRDSGHIHTMRKFEPDDPGVINYKVPTILLLSPSGEFASLGYAARNQYHNLSPTEAKSWLYFENLKTAVIPDVHNMNVEIKASSGLPFRALEAFTHVLRFLKESAFAEVRERSEIRIDDVLWVITVPGIWKEPAKHFIRQAAYRADMASRGNPQQLVIASEQEVALRYLLKQTKVQQLSPEIGEESVHKEEYCGRLRGYFSGIRRDDAAESDSTTAACMSASFQKPSTAQKFKTVTVYDVIHKHKRFMVVDCGSATVDISVYEISPVSQRLTEIHKPTAKPIGSYGVNREFEALLADIFGADFIALFKQNRPAGWDDFILAFESRKRAANPFINKTLNVAPPFSFLDCYSRFSQGTDSVSSALWRYKDKNVRLSSAGMNPHMINLIPDVMRHLFEPMLNLICETITGVLFTADATGVATPCVTCMFLVGGFSESLLLQQAVTNQFGRYVDVVVSKEASVAALKGAVCFGVDRSVLKLPNIRKSRKSYGVAVLKRFVRGKHPMSKVVNHNGVEWSRDIFDPIIHAGQKVTIGAAVMRRYVPADFNQESCILEIYASVKSDVRFITEENAHKCCTLFLALPQETHQRLGTDRREVQLRITFGESDILVVALDVVTGHSVTCTISE